MRVCVIIPVYNEEYVIENTVKEAKKYVKENENASFIFVNDGSLDKSKEIIEKTAGEDEKIRLLSYDKNMGKGFAVRFGMLNADADAVIFTDSDLAYGLDSVKELAEKLEKEDFDIIVGSRNISKEGYGQYGFLRRIASKTYIKMLSVFGGLKLSDSQCGLKGYKNPYARKIFALCECDRFAFDFESILIAEKMGLRIGEMAVTVKKHGESKVRIVRDTVKMLRDLRRIRRRVKKLKI